MKGGNDLGINQYRITYSLLAIVLLVQFSHALEIPSSLKMRLMGDMGGANSSMANTSTTMDNSIDPDQYFVGGGDLFQISIVGLPSQEYFGTVDQDGNLYIGDLGLIQLGKITLSQAKAIIARQVKGILKKNHEVYVNLRTTKSPVVTVSGILSNPGTHRLEGTSRLLDAIKMANGQSLPDTRDFNFREVTVINRDSSQSYDLLRFIANSDLSQNPYVYPGDNIILESANRRAYIAGEVIDFNDEWVPIKKDENLKNLLDIARLKSSADSDFIFVQTLDENGETKINRYSMESAADVQIGHQAVITVPARKNQNRNAVATLAGEVVRPGKYPVSENKTTAADLIELAGGVLPTGTVQTAFIIQSKRDLFGLENKVLKNSTNGLNTAMTEQHQLDLALAGLQKSRPEISSSLYDLHKLGDYMIVEIKGKPENFLLRDGDELYFPKPEKFVYVSGSVSKPGSYRYEKGKDYKYYVKKAGGYTSKADKGNQFVVANYQKLIKIKGVDELAAGDVIVVPSAIEYKRYMSVYLPIIQMIPGILTLALTFMLYQAQLK